MTDWRDTDFTRLLGIDLPIVLGPFGGASSSVLTAAVSEAGGLGSYGLHGVAPERIGAIAAEIRERTARPFALNLWVPSSPEEGRTPPAAEWEAGLAPLAPLFEELGLELPSPPPRLLPDFDEQAEAVLAARPAALSLVYGVPPAALVERCRGLGIRLLGTATTVEEATALARAGVDAVVATGMEAAGHRVSFLRAPEDSLVGTIALVPAVADALDVPVVAAGGIADGRGLAAALTLGAGAAQLGTAFLACDESAANAAHRGLLWGPRAARTELTRAFSGRLSRGIPTGLQRRLERAGGPAAFPARNWLTARLRAEGARRGDPELVSAWAGQGAPLLRHRRAADLVSTLVAEADALLG